MIDKARLREAILAQLAADLDLQTRAALLARDEAISDESKAEGKYDTRAQEAAYLAEGQARQAAELHDSIALYRALEFSTRTDVAEVGSLIRLSAGSNTIDYLLGPRAGGLEIEVDGRQITVVTPASPLGRQLLGAAIGATVTLPGRGRATRYSVTDIQ